MNSSYVGIALMASGFVTTLLATLAVARGGYERFAVRWWWTGLVLVITGCVVGVVGATS